MAKTMGLIVTLDTKGEVAKYFKDRIESNGLKCLVVDSGIRGSPLGVKPDITREEVALAAGSDIVTLSKEKRGVAIEVMKKGVAVVVERLHRKGKFQGIFSIGGEDGMHLAAPAMQRLPVGVPKMLLSPIFQGTSRFGHYVGTKDIIFIHSVTDILGVNIISKKIFDNALNAMIGMVNKVGETEISGTNLIATTMYGNTTPAVMCAKKILEAKGYELIAFHPNGTGGRAMEEFIEEGVFAGVLDMTPQELVDELFEGTHAAGPHRLEAAGLKGVPQVVVPGCVDFINEGPLSELPAKYRNRKVYSQNPTSTLIRVNRKEMKQVALEIAKKLNRAKGPVVMVIPLRGLSMYNKKGESLFDPEVDKVLDETLKKSLDPKVEIKELDCHINDPILAQTAVSELLRIMQK